jgi:hypothetical protein
MPIFKKAKAADTAATLPRPEGPSVNILDIQKAFDNRSERRQAEHLRVIYSMNGTTGDVRAAITWEALAQLRLEMQRAGKSISERGVLDFVLLPWIMEQLQSAHDSNEHPPEEGYTLDFGPAPKPREVHEILVRFGLLAA